MADLSAEEIAELRRLLPPIARGDSVTMARPAYEEIRNALPRLLDEVDRAREMRRIIRGCPPEHGTEHAPYCADCCAQFDPGRMVLRHEARCGFLGHERATD